MSDRKEYLKRYNKQYYKRFGYRINERKREMYRLNINGYRDKAIERAKKRYRRIKEELENGDQLSVGQDS